MTWNDTILWLRDHSGVPMLIVFLLLVATAYWPRNKERMQGHASIPLRDEQEGV